MIIVLTDDSKADASGERILVKGLDLSRYLKNPVLFYNHERWRMPVGSLVNVRKDGSRVIADGIKFDEADELSRIVKGKFEAGSLSAFSVGIRYKEKSNEPGFRLPEQRGATYTKSELMECSIVGIPDLAEAVVERGYVQKFFNAVVDNKTHESLMTKEEEQQALADRVKSLEQAIEEMTGAEAAQSFADKAVKALEQAIEKMTGIETVQSLADKVKPLEQAIEKMTGTEAAQSLADKVKSLEQAIEKMSESKASVKDLLEAFKNQGKPAEKETLAQKALSEMSYSERVAYTLQQKHKGGTN